MNVPQLPEPRYPRKGMMPETAMWYAESALLAAEAALAEAKRTNQLLERIAELLAQK